MRILFYSLQSKLYRGKRDTLISSTLKLELEHILITCLICERYIPLTWYYIMIYINKLKRDVLVGPNDKVSCKTYGFKLMSTTHVLAFVLFFFFLKEVKFS